MKKSFILTLLLLGNMLMAENNVSDSNSTTKHNATMVKNINSSTIQKNESNLSKESITAQQVREQMEREKKYAKEQVFYQGDDYDLSAHEVNKASLADVPLIETDLDFDMDDVYRDDI